MYEICFHSFKLSVDTVYFNIMIFIKFIIFEESFKN